MVLLTCFALLAAERLTDPAEIVARLATADRANEKLAKQYMFTQRTEERALNRDGSQKSLDSQTEEVIFLYGRPYVRMIERNGKPLEGKEAAKEEEKLRKESAKRAGESADDRARRELKEEKEDQNIRKVIAEVPKSHQLTLESIETVDGREVYRVRAEPRKSYNRRLPPYGFLRKLRGTLWIDCADFQLIKVDAEVVESMSLGLVVAMVSPGTELHFSQTRVNGEVWLPKSASIRLDGRLGLIKKVRRSVDVAWSGFRKFSADSRIVSAAEADPR
jgi:hypothetical protein